MLRDFTPIVYKKIRMVYSNLERNHKFYHMHAREYPVSTGVIKVDGISYTHYTGDIMTTTASPIASLTVVYSTVYSDADQRKHQSSAPLACMWGIHGDRWISRIRGQLRGKWFHFMTSSCVVARCNRNCHLANSFVFYWYISQFWWL